LANESKFTKNSEQQEAPDFTHDIVENIMSNIDVSTPSGQRDYVIQNLKDLWRIAQYIHSAGVVPNSLNSTEKLFVVIMKAVELNIPTMQAIQNMYLVPAKGGGFKLGMEGKLMLSLIIQAGHKYQILEQTDKICRMKFERKGFEPHEFQFTFEQAQKAGLTGKDNWKYPEIMLMWRCVSKAANALFSDVTGGMLTPEELESVAPVKAVSHYQPNGHTSSEPPDPDDYIHPKHQHPLLQIVKGGWLWDFDTQKQRYVKTMRSDDLDTTPTSARRNPKNDVNPVTGSIKPNSDKWKPGNKRMVGGKIFKMDENRQWFEVDPLTDQPVIEPETEPGEKDTSMAEMAEKARQQNKPKKTTKNGAAAQPMLF